MAEHNQLTSVPFKGLRLVPVC